MDDEIQRRGDRRYYDRVHYSATEVAGRAERKMTVADPWYQLIEYFLTGHEIPVSGRHILEIGCGLGGFSARLARKGARVTALDFSASAVVAARRLSHNSLSCFASDSDGAASPFFRPHSPPAYLVADARRLPFRPASFDLVICAETLEHTFAVRRCVGEMARVCRPGGFVAVTVPNSLLSLPLDLAVSWLGVGQPQKPLNYYKLRDICQNAGFTVQDAYGTNFCRTMFSEDVLPAAWRRGTAWAGRRVAGWMRTSSPLWPVLAGTVGLLLRKPGRSAG